MNDKLQSCKTTRKIASKSLYKTLENVFKSNKKISEAQFRDLWLLELRKHKNIFPNGWYIPPPHGIGVLFGTTDKNSRHNYQSLRTKENWPQNNIFLTNSTPLIYVYASPVDRKTGIIGDFGMTIYCGKNRAIQNHLKTCFASNKEIANYIRVGMTFSDVYQFAQKRFATYRVTNEITSTTDKAGVNIGHTVPGSYKGDEWSNKKLNFFKKADLNWSDAKNKISKKRKFINALEQKTLKKDMAITIEPRLTVADNPSIPMASFHTIVIIHDNCEKELLTDFDEIFRLTGMTYMA